MQARYHRCKAIVQKLNFVLGIIGPVYASWVIYAFASAGVDPQHAVFHLVFWSLGPPIWFFIEYNVLLEEDGSNLDRLKYGQEVAGKIWAAVLATLLLFYPNGPLEGIGKLAEALGKS